jgi:hypothetical protein
MLGADLGVSGRVFFTRACDVKGVEHRDTEAQRHSLKKIAQQAVSLCLCVSVSNPTAAHKLKL